MQAHFLPDEARARFAQDRFAAVERIARIAAEEDCAFVVVAGDVFDSNHVDRRVVAKAVDALAAFSVPVYILPGNHDPIAPSSVYWSEPWTAHVPDLVTVIDEVVAIPVPGAPGIEVVGDPWPTRARLSDPAAACYENEGGGSERTRVVIAHGVVDELSPQSTDPSLIESGALRHALTDGAIHYAAFGDRHSVTEINGTAGRAWYSGTPVATKQGLQDPNDVLVVTLDAASCEVQRRTVGSWSFRRETRDLNSLADVEALGAWLDVGDDKATTVMELDLRGAISLSTSARLAAVLDESRLKYASLEERKGQAELVLAPDDGDLADLEVSGYVREALDQLIDEAGDAGPEAIRARDALNLLYRLAR
jgi:DNA repair exonuclease SbcCD nuclease subunit